MAALAMVVRGCKTVWHKFQDSEIQQLLRAYEGCPYFSPTTEREWEGTALKDCQPVLQLYAKIQQKEAVATFLWRTVFTSVSQDSSQT